MSDEIKKICKNCDNLQYGFGESSISYGPRCFEKDCGVDENDTCNMFELASYLKVKNLQEQNKILIEALKFVIKESGLSTNYNKMAREALAKVGE